MKNVMLHKPRAMCVLSRQYKILFYVCRCETQTRHLRWPKNKRKTNRINNRISI